MAEFKGLSILMDAKDIGVKRTLQQIKGQFRTLSSEMSRSSSNFKNTERSMETLKQRSKELKKGIEVTESSMRDIAAQLKRMSQEEQRTSAHAEKLRNEYSRQHRALNMYQRQLASTDKEMKQFNSTSKRTVFSMEKINTILGTMRKQLNIANMSFERAGKSTKSYQNYLNQLSVVMDKHKNTIQVLESRYRKVVREQGEMSKEAIDLKQKILEEKQALNVLDKQFKDTTLEAKRFSMEQRTMTMSMSQIREKITSVATALKISASNFRMSGQTAQAYKARISELNNSMKQQQLIVQNLSRQYDYAKRQYGSTSKEAQALNLKLTEERVKLKELNGQLKETTNAHNRLEMEQKQGISSMSQIRAKMQAFNDTLSLSRSNLSRAGESVNAYGNHLKTLNTNMSQQRTVLRELSTQYKFVAQAQGENSQEARELSSAIAQQKIKMNELETEIKQTATQYKQLAAEQRNADRLSATGFGRSVQSVNKYKDSLQSINSQMRSVGTGALIYMTMPAVAAIGGGIKASVEWEQALAGVAKTTNMSGGELNKMGKEITNMSNTLPFAATEIAGVAESAGQLGVKKQDITAFTKTMLDMGVATNLTADEAATEFARFANAAKMPISDVDRLGSTVTALGNTTATTEKEIVDMSQRLAGAGAQAGFSANEIMSISAAMSSAGIESEAGGTAMTQIFNKMTNAVANGGETLDSFAQTAGVSAEEFASTWENNPSKALSMFVKGLSNTEGGAKGVLKALDSVGIKGVREADTIRRMANNHELLEGALKTGSKAWNENTALTDEARIRYETMGSKLKVLKNTFMNFLRTLGEAIAPVVIKISDALTGLFKYLQNTSNATKIAITVFGLLAAAIPPILIGIGLLGTAIVNTANAIQILNATKGGAKFFSLFNGGIKSALPKIGQMLTRIPLLGSVFTLLTGPIGIAVAAIAAIGTAFVIAYKKSETFRNIVHTVIDPVINAFKKLWDFLKTLWDGITQIFNGNTETGGNILEKILPKQAAQDLTDTLLMIKNAFKSAMDFIKNTTETIGIILKVFWKIYGDDITNAFNKIRDTISTVLGFIYNNIIKPILGGIKNAFSIAFSGLRDIVINSFSAVKGIVQGALTAISGVIKFFKGIFTGDFDLMWQGIKQVFFGALQFIGNLIKLTFGNMLIVVKSFMQQIWNAIKTGFGIAYNLVQPILSGLLSFIKKIFFGIISYIISTTSNIKTFIVNGFNGAYNIVKMILTGLWNFIKQVFFGIVTYIVSTSNRIKSFIVSAFNIAYNLVRGILNGLLGFIKKVFFGMMTYIVSVTNRIKTFIVTAWTFIKNKVIGLAKGIWQGLKTVFNYSWAFIRFVFTAIRNFMVSIWNYIKNRVIAIVKSLVGNVKKWFNNLYSGIKNIFNSVKNFIIKVWTLIKNKIVSIVKSLWSSIKNVFNALYSGTRNIFNKLKNWLINIWNNIKRNVTRIVASLWSSVKRTFNNLYSGIRNIFSKVKSWLTNTWNSIKRSVTGIASSIWNSVRRTFNNMASGLKSIIGKIKSHITGMVNAVKNGLNKLIKGVNWVAGKIGMDKIPELKLHTGTTHTHSTRYVSNGKINQDTFATVGDKGRGNGPGGFRHEMIRYPNGKSVITPNRDTTAYLPKGSQVLNGQQTHAALNGGSLPKFSMGTMFDVLSDKKKPRVHKHGDDLPGDVIPPKGGGGSEKPILGRVIDKGKGIASKAMGAVAKGKDWLSKTVGDVLDYIDNPGKLLTKVLDAFGVNFDFLKNAEIPYKMMTAIFKKLKKAATDLFSGWLEDAGGAGEGGWVDISKGVNFPFSPNGRAPGYPFNSPHFGVDLNYVYDKLYSTHSGTATARTGYNGGFGNMVSIISGIYEIIYGHMSKHAFSGSKKVKPGTYLGVSGNTGRSSGPHLHYEMRKNGTPIDPMPFLKSQNKGGNVKGGSGAAYASKIIKQAQNILGGRYKGSYVHSQMMRVAKRESNYQSDVVNDWDINAQRGDPSKGLFQIIGSTFRANAKSGYTNFNNPLHQAISAMRYIVNRYGWGGFQRAGDYAYATGGLIKNSGLYNLAEGGYPEYVIPTDPSRKSDAMKLLALAAHDIDKGKTSSNKRPGQLPSINKGNDNTELLLQMIENQQQQINVLMEIARSSQTVAEKDYQPVLDDSSFERRHNRYQDRRERRERKSNMYRGGAFV